MTSKRRLSDNDISKLTFVKEMWLLVENVNGGGDVPRFEVLCVDPRLAAEDGIDIMPDNWIYVQPDGEGEPRLVFVRDASRSRTLMEDTRDSLENTKSKWTKKKPKSNENMSICKTSRESVAKANKEKNDNSKKKGVKNTRKSSGSEVVEPKRRRSERLKQFDGAVPSCSGISNRAASSPVIPSPVIPTPVILSPIIPSPVIPSPQPIRPLSAFQPVYRGCRPPSPVLPLPPTIPPLSAIPPYVPGSPSTSPIPSTPSILNSPPEYSSLPPPTPSPISPLPPSPPRLISIPPRLYPTVGRGRSRVIMSEDDSSLNSNDSTSTSDADVLTTPRNRRLMAIAVGRFLTQVRRQQYRRRLRRARRVEPFCMEPIVYFPTSQPGPSRGTSRHYERTTRRSQTPFERPSRVQRQDDDDDDDEDRGRKRREKQRKKRGQRESNRDAEHNGGAGHSRDGEFNGDAEHNGDAGHNNGVAEHNRDAEHNEETNHNEEAEDAEQCEEEEQSGEEEQCEEEEQSAEEEQCDEEQSGEEQSEVEQSGEEQSEVEQSGEEQSEVEQSGEEQSEGEQSGEVEEDDDDGSNDSYVEGATAFLQLGSALKHMVSQLNKLTSSMRIIPANEIPNRNGSRNRNHSRNRNRFRNRNDVRNRNEPVDLPEDVSSGAESDHYPMNYESPENQSENEENSPPDPEPPVVAADRDRPPVDVEIPPANAQVPPENAEIPPENAEIPPADAEIPPPEQPRRISPPVIAVPAPSVQRIPTPQQAVVGVVERVERDDQGDEDDLQRLINENMPGPSRIVSVRRVSAHTTSRRGERGEMVPIGDGRALVPARLLEKIDWTCYTTATRQLLQSVFPRKVLATHSLTGKPSPAFLDKPGKKKLDPELVEDIVIIVMQRCRVNERMVRQIITLKCTDEAKLYKNRRRGRRGRASGADQENVPPDQNSDQTTTESSST